MWDLDLADPIEPYQVLKGHTGALTSLSLHEQRNNILLSGSADKLVKVWDLSQLKEVDSLSNFKHEIQNIKWSPNQDSVFMCHSGKKQLDLFDLKASSTSIANANLKGPELDTITYNGSNANQILASSITGQIFCWDVRMLSKHPLYSFQAHSKNIPGLVVSGDYLVSNSLDGKVRIWDMSGSSKPKLIKEKQTPIKQLFISSIHPENPFLFACGASGPEVVVWDFEKEVIKGEDCLNPEIEKDPQSELDEIEEEN